MSKKDDIIGLFLGNSNEQCRVTNFIIHKLIYLMLVRNITTQ